jgi:hypothetical protein
VSEACVLVRWDPFSLSCCEVVRTLDPQRVDDECCGGAGMYEAVGGVRG